jgi:hypothetical protein
MCGERPAAALEVPMEEKVRRLEAQNRQLNERLRRVEAALAVAGAALERAGQPPAA